jgi:tetratricopeptide (TPR) repeat protein
MHDIAPPAQPAGYYNVDHPFGVLTNLPLVWLALAAPLAWRNRSAAERSLLRWFLGAAALLFGLCALPLCLHDSMCLRYEMDYASPLALLAVMGVLGLERALAGQPGRLRAARLGWGLLLTFSVVFNLLASFQLQADSDLSFGYALLQEGKVDEAILQYRKVLEARPDYAKARNNLGSALAMKGDLDGAAAQYRQALETTPDYPEAIHNLGKVLLLQGDWGGAMACLDRTTAGSADPPARWNNLGNAFLKEPDWQCAVVCYRQAISLNPRSAEAYANLGLAFYKKGEIKEAMDAWQRSLEIKPDQLYVLNNLAWLLATTPDAALRDGAKAVALAKQAGALGGEGNPMTPHTLAAAYAETGSYGLAAATARRGLELATEQKNGALAATLQKEIQLYEARAPVREGAAQGGGTAPPGETPQRTGPTARDAPR